MVDILEPQEGETIYDPATGTGGMLLGAVEHVRARGGDPRTFYGKLYGQEKNLTTASVARMSALSSRRERTGRNHQNAQSAQKTSPDARSAQSGAIGIARKKVTIGKFSPKR